MSENNKGYIQVYTGNGKGKTTAAIGLAIRALGAGKKVFFAQFIKGQVYSEVRIIQNLENIVIKQYGINCFIVNDPTPEDIDAACEGLKEVSKVILSEEYDVVVLDEITIALYYKLFNVTEVIELLQSKPEQTEIVITGRYAPDELIDLADLVSEMKEVKHYYASEGIEARLGIEF